MQINLRSFGQRLPQFTNGSEKWKKTGFFQRITGKSSLQPSIKNTMKQCCKIWKENQNHTPFQVSLQQQDIKTVFKLASLKHLSYQQTSLRKCPEYLGKIKKERKLQLKRSTTSSKPADSKGAQGHLCTTDKRGSFHCQRSQRFKNTNLTTPQNCLDLGPIVLSVNQMKKSLLT